MDKDGKPKGTFEPGVNLTARVTVFGEGPKGSLMREVGEWVSTGDVIALAGDSGGRDRAGLYFEIRRNGKPVNPDRWCNSRVTLPPIALK